MTTKTPPPKSPKVPASKPSETTKLPKITVDQCFKPSTKILPDKAEKIDDKKIIVEFKHLTFSKNQLIYNVELKMQRTHKKVLRSRPDAWRRYGAQRIIHQIGGHVLYFQQTKTGARRTKKIVQVKPNTPMTIPEPKEKPILTQEDFYVRPIVLGATPSSASLKSEDPCENTSASASAEETRAGNVCSMPTTPKGPSHLQPSDSRTNMSIKKDQCDAGS